LGWVDVSYLLHAQREEGDEEGEREGERIVD